MRKHHSAILSEAGISDAEASAKMQGGKPAKRQKTDSSFAETTFNSRLTKYHQLAGAPKFGLANQQLKFNALTLLWIHKNFRPYSLIEDKGLQDMISFASGMSGEAQLFPSQDAFRLASSMLNARCDEKMRAMIKDDADYFSVTVDTWEASPPLSFIAFLLHFTNERFETKTVTLRIATLPKGATGESVDEMLVQTLDSWGLAMAKMTVLMRGNGRSLENAFSAVEAPIEPCAGLCLHWIISPFYALTTGSLSDGDIAEFEMDERASSQMSQEHVSSVRHVVQKARELVAFIRGSADAQIKMQEYHTSPDATETAAFDKALKGDASAQWPSTHEMIDSAVQRQPAISHFLAYLDTVDGQTRFQNQKLPQITPAEFALLAGIQILLTPFYSLIDGLRTEKTPEMICAYPMLRKVQEILNTTNLFQNTEAGVAARERCGPVISGALEKLLGENSKNEYFSSVAATLEACQITLKEEFTARFKSLENIFQWASLLDPRLRKQHHCSDEERQQAKDSLVFEMVALAQASVPQASSVQGDQQLMASEKRRPFYTTMFNDVFDDPGEVHGHDVNPLRTPKEEGTDESIEKVSARNELSAYLAAPAVPMNSSPWNWWQANGVHYPMLARVARKWLSVSVAPWIPDDRVFSNTGLVTATFNPSMRTIEENSPDFEQQLQINSKLNSLALPADEVAEFLHTEIPTTNQVSL